MKFELKRTSEDSFKDIEVNSLEELMEIVQECEYEVIIGKEDGYWYLEIYDTYKRD